MMIDVYPCISITINHCTLYFSHLHVHHAKLVYPQSHFKFAKSQQRPDFLEQLQPLERRTEKEALACELNAETVWISPKQTTRASARICVMVDPQMPDVHLQTSVFVVHDSVCACVENPTSNFEMSFCQAQEDWSYRIAKLLVLTKLVPWVPFYTSLYYIIFSPGYTYIHTYIPYHTIPYHNIALHCIALQYITLHEYKTYLHTQFSYA